MEAYFKFFKLLFAILITAILLTEATIFTNNTHKVTVDNTNISDSRLFYIISDEGLVEVNSHNHEVIGKFQRSEKILAVDYHYLRGLLFWTNYHGELYSCSFADFKQKNVSLLYKDEKWLPVSLGVDYINDSLYVLDVRSNIIRITDLDGKNTAILVVAARKFKPKYIELDPTENFIFLMDDSIGGIDRNGAHGHILRMKMDGKDPKIIDPPSFANEIQTGRFTLDRPNKKILVSSRLQKKIFSMDYNGKVIGTILESQNGTLSLSLVRSELFWINDVYYRHSLGTAFVDGSAYKCNYKSDSTCSSILKLHDGPNNGYLKNILAIQSYQQETNISTKICSQKQCLQEQYQICVSSDCGCKIGWHRSNRKCEPINEFLIYEDSSVVRGICLKKEETNCVPFVPFSQMPVSSKKYARNGFEYDSTTGFVYYGGLHALYRADLKTGKNERLIFQKNILYGPLALDWVTKNLFYTEIERRGLVSYYLLKIMSVRYNDPNKIHASTSHQWEFPMIYKLAINPYRGYVYVAGRDGGKNVVMRLESNARNPKFLTNLNNTAFISIDYLTDELYTLNANTSTILRSDFEGNNTKVIASTAHIPNITSLLVHDQTIYVQNVTGIYKYDKTSGQFFGQLDLFPYDQNLLYSLRLHSPKIFRENLTNPCAVNNGGCDNFCFALPKKNGFQKVCECYEGIKCKVNNWQFKEKFSSMTNETFIFKKN